MHLIDHLEYLKEVNNNYRKTLEVFNGDWSFLSKLEQALNAGKSNIMSRVRDIYGDTITENDYLILAGLFAGMSPATISLITGVKEGTIRVKKSRFIDRFEQLVAKERQFRRARLATFPAQYERFVPAEYLHEPDETLRLFEGRGNPLLDPIFRNAPGFRGADHNKRNERDE